MKINLKPINQQVVVLLGATSGIGLETAMYFAEKGARIAIVGRSQEGLDDALNQVRNHINPMQQGQSQNAGVYEGGGMGNSSGGGFGVPVAVAQDQVIGLEADVTNFDQVKSAADQVVQQFGRIDTWVNLAAVSEWALFEDTSPDEFHRIVEVNLLGQTYGAMAALPYLKQQASGALIFVASVNGRLPVPYQAAYNASKHGVLGLADTLRLELKHTGIPVSVTAILPASINTPIFEKSRTKLGVEPYPIPPIYNARMVAQAIAFAAEHPVRELTVGDAGIVMTFLQRMAPTLTGNMLGAKGFREQRSNEPKSAQAPDNLYQHVEGYDAVRGDYTGETTRFGVLTWMETHPKARMAIFGGLLLGVGALVGWRVMASRQQKDWRHRLPKQVSKASRKASKQIARSSKQVAKSTRKTLESVGGMAATVPLISNMPMFRRRTLLQRISDDVTDFLADVWDFITAIDLPFVQRQSRIERFTSNLSDMIPNVDISGQRKAVAHRVNKMSNKLMNQVDDTRKKAMKSVSKTTSQVSDVSKKAQKQAQKQAYKAAKQAIKTSQQAQKAADKAQARAARGAKERMQTLKLAGEQMPTKREMRAMAKANGNKDVEVVREVSLIERLPFGQRRETITEKSTVK